MPILAAGGPGEPRDLSPTPPYAPPVPRAAPAVPIESAGDFTGALMARATEAQRVAYRRYFPADDSFAGVRMGEVFDLAKRALGLPVADIEALLESAVHEVRAGACSVMGKAATHRRAAADRRRELFHLYLRRHDRIDGWDLVDLAAMPRPMLRAATEKFDRGTRSGLLARR